MIIESFEKKLKLRIAFKNVASVLITMQIALILFGTAGMAFYYDSVFNDKPEYLKHFDNTMFFLKDSIDDKKETLTKLLSEERDNTSISKFNLEQLSADFKGVKDSIDGYTEAINKNKNSVVNSLLSSKRALLIMLSIFFIFYVKFLVDLYIHNANQASRDRAILDALELSKISIDEEIKIDMEVFKEFIAIFDLPFNKSKQQDLNIETLISKVSK